MATTEPVQRSVTLDVFATDERRQDVLNSIRKYRAVCRQVYATLLLAQTAGASVEEHETGPRLKPDGDGSKLALAAALGSAKIERGKKTKGEGQEYKVQIGSGLAYELREYVRKELWPTALSYVWDSIRRDVTTVWTSKDPEHTQAKRGWLALQGARGIAQFNWRGIGIPVATGRPKLERDLLALKWDHEIGSLTFKLPRLDGGRYFVWKNLRDGSDGWELGTIYLNERDGKLKVTMTYTKPASVAQVDPKRVCRVKLVADKETLLRIVGPDGAATYDTIASADVLAWLVRRRQQKELREAERSACGAPRRDWGRRKGWNCAQRIIAKLTLRREQGVKNHNHAWARRIVARATAWRCGRIEINKVPDDLAGYPWKWQQLVDFITYKSQERGIESCSVADE